MPTKDDATRTSELIQDHQAEIEAEWLAQLEAAVLRGDAGSKARLRSHCQQLRSAFTNATRSGALENIEHCARDEMRDLLGEISSSPLPRLFNPNAARWNDHDSPPDPDPQR